MGTSHFSLASCLKDRWIIYRKVIGNKKLLVRAGIEREGRLSTDSPTPIADLSARSRKYVLLYTSSKESRSRKMHDGKSGKTKPSCTQNEKGTYWYWHTVAGHNQSPTNTLPSIISFSKKIKKRLYWVKLSSSKPRNTCDIRLATVPMIHRDRN